ncbi:uncharacterized protein LOC117641481 isoform X1 [Thrips palmi]|uniref:Uncharacterized protein LOC117641481 isoform X1 n=1 Tax=Thrips palmi TaxID=161013 RepID=A0A6P8YL64_THRPL|nr:uncharacterized protein LOC117641481 isoform X1 [Thrips palmi]
MAPVRKEPQAVVPQHLARRILDRMWTSPGTSYAAFAGQHLLRRAAAEPSSRKTKLEPEDVRRYLTQEPAYTQHAPRRERFTKPFYNMVKLWHLVETDLLETGRVANFNDGVRYLLLAIECTSRKLYVKPLKNKEGKTCAEAFRELLENEFPKYPDIVRSDRGSEYKDKGFQKMLKDRGIRHLFASNTEKAAICERAGQTLQRRLHRYMTHNNTYSFLPVLQDMVKSINDTPHSTTLVAPNKFSESDVYPAWERNYLRHMPHIPDPRPYRFEVGDPVRVSLLRRSMDKAYRGTFSPQVFTVKARRKTRPHTYELRNAAGEPVDGLFFEQELILAKDRPDRRYMIEKEHDRRVNPQTKKKEVQVSWVGWPPSVRDWIPATAQVTTGKAVPPPPQHGKRGL